MRTTLVLLAATLFALAGCGQPPPEVTTPGGTSVPAKEEAPGMPPGTVTPPTGVPSAPVSVGPTGTVVPEGVTQVPAEQVDATALPMELKDSGEIWLFDEGRALQLYATAKDGCSGVTGMIVDQNSDEVRIALSAMDSTQGGRPDDSICTQALEPVPVVVQLDEPLGDRTIYLASGR